MPVGAKFCRDCGSPVQARSCSSCGTASDGGKFCAECGTPLDPADSRRRSATPQSGEPVAERRVTSVLFGDLVGFTPLSESKDAEEVRELLSAYFAQCRVIVGRYGGVVEKFIGDAVMAVWGVPVAHEDDAERAVRAGLELAAATAAMGAEVGAPGLAMRVGIVTGEVAVTLGATAEGMVAGDAVNTAARVQSTAEPGRVWVDEATRSLASAAITFSDTGEHPLKGKAEPMRLWAADVVVAEVGGGQRVDGLEAPFTGRTADLRLVKDLFHGTEESRRPKLVLLDGEAGIGKSRLAWEFEKYIDGLAAGVLWHRGRCLSYGDGVAFWALAEAMRARFGLVEADTGDTVTERLDAGLIEFVPEQSDRDWLRPRLAVLLGAGGGSSFARPELFAAWTAFLEHLAADGEMVVLVVDDAQHADDGSAGLPGPPPRHRPGTDLRAGPGPPGTADPASGVGWAPDECRAPRPARRRRHGEPGGRSGGRPPRRRTSGPGASCRGDPAVRRRDGASVDRPRPGRSSRRTVRPRGRRRPGPRRHRRARVVAGPGRRPSRRVDDGGEEGRHRRQRPGLVLHHRGVARAGHRPRRTSRACWSRCVAKRS